MRSGLIVAVFALAATAGAAPRAGKVVRVERRSHGLSGAPRVCPLHTDLSATCFGGNEPQVGDRLTALDQNRVLGILRITQVTPFNDGCPEVSQWSVRTVADSGDPSAARGSWIAVGDVSLDTRSARWVNVDKTPTGHTWGSDVIYAIDDHGDGTVDIEFVQYVCDDAGNLSITAPTSTCYEVWAPVNGHTLERVRSERYRNCN